MSSLFPHTLTPRPSHAPSYSPLQVTPMLSLDPGKPADDAIRALSLDDVWRFYSEPSLYGREVYTLGGQRGPSLCYFVPYLSAIQLFTPAAGPEDADPEGASRCRLNA